MDIAVVLNIHGKIDVVKDTIDSINFHGTNKIITIIDGAFWPQLKEESLDAAKVEGFYHNAPKAPYRNVALGLKTIFETYPNVNWYCYTEYDTLFTSERFKKNLELAENKKVWMMGNDGQIANEELPLIQAMFKNKFKNSYYLLGSCLFFHRDFLAELDKINFFDKFLNLTNSFKDGFFPYYKGYDLSEHLYPTLCRHLGGNIGVFAHYDYDGTWHGSYKYFPIRWRPEIDPDTENFTEASIIHPLKDYSHPIRVQHREKRQKCKSLQRMEKQSV